MLTPEEEKELRELQKKREQMGQTITRREQELLMKAAKDKMD